MRPSTVFDYLQGGASAIISYCRAARAAGLGTWVKQEQWCHEGQWRIRNFLEDTRTNPARIDWLAKMNEYIDLINADPAGIAFAPAPHFEELLQPLIGKSVPTSDEEIQHLEKAALELYWFCGNFKWMLQDVGSPRNRFSFLLHSAPSVGT